MKHQIGDLPCGRLSGRYAGALTIGLGLALGSAVVAGERVQGLFCNTEAQIDAALASLGAGLDPDATVDLINRESVVCTYVDLLHYEIEDPVDIGTSRSFLQSVKYRGWLVGVVAGNAVRPVSPPVELHFVTPELLPRAAVERRT